MDLWDTILESEDTFVLEADDDKKDAKDSDTKTKKEDSKEPEKEEKSDTDDSGEDTPDKEDGGDEEPPSDDDMEEPPAEDGEDSDTPPEDGAEPGAEGEGGEVAPESTPAQDDGKNSKVNTIVLLDNFISLYKMIDNTIKKISESRKDNILASVTFNQVRANLSRLAGVVYKYITLYYDGNDHALNLYNFKYFMEILKLNLEMIRKVSSTNKETETSI
nr:MAG TPA: hypothetical protein [Caudoviricetes sp.]